MPAPIEVQTVALERFIDGWKGWTPNGFLDTWTKTCSQTTLPFSSGIAPRTRADTEHIFPILMSLLTNFELTVHNVVHDAANGKAVVYALTKADSPMGPYRNEHALFLWFNESGEKVDKIEEMFDGVFMKDFLPKLEQHVAQMSQHTV